MKFKKTNVLKKVVFILSLLGVGASTWFITSAILNTINQKSFTEYLEPSNRESIRLKKSADVPIELIEHETNGFYFFGHEGLKMINERIKLDLQFGSEVESLKSIRINNLGILSQNVNGQYNPLTEEIEISISNLIQPFKNIPLSEKIDLIFPTIYHEYGHHLANTYITSIATNDPRNSKKLFTKFGDKSIYKNIPSAFLEEFEKSLHYSDSEISNLLGNDNSKISSFKTAKQLYDESNGIDIKNNVDKSDFLKIDSLNFSTQIPFKNKIIDFLINSNRYTYLFSIDELLTRKFQQISYIDRLNVKGLSIANNSTTFTGTQFDNGFSPSTMATDISRNKQIEWLPLEEKYQISNELLLIDDPYGGTFIDENNQEHIVPNNVKQLWNAYIDIIGSDYGISQIFLENTSIQVNKNQRSALLKENFEKIKFTGFLDNLEGNNYKGLILKDKSGMSVVHSFLENNYNYKLLSVKSHVLSTELDYKQPSMKFGYSTDYIDISNIDLNQPIKVWNDSNYNNKIDLFEAESLSVSQNRPTTTFRESFMRTFEDGTLQMDSDIQNRNFYEVVVRNGDAFLKIYETTNTTSFHLRNLDVNNFGRTRFIYIPDDIIMLNNWHQKKKN